MRHAVLPLWREAFLGLDWLSLRASSVYRGASVPRGDGSGVIVVPGFLGSDGYLRELHAWLGRIGYQPFLSGIGRNTDCPDALTLRLHQTVETAYAQTGRRVHLIGHSLGGVLSRSVAVRWPGLVASVITLASPFRGVAAHPLVLEAGAIIRGRVISRRPEATAERGCYTSLCSCAFAGSIKRELPAPVGETAIYTRTDGVVDWRRCINDDPETDIEVSGTHVGLAFNSSVYRHIAERLARFSAGAAGRESEVAGAGARRRKARSARTTP